MKLQNLLSSFVFWFNNFLYVVVILHSVSLLFQPSSTIFTTALGNDTDRFALLKFKESISNDPHGILNSWNDSVHFCSWTGISCSSRHQRVTELNMSGFKVTGTISPYVGNLSFIRSLNLMYNSFYGEIPPQLGRLFRLQKLGLYSNMLEGNIPLNLSYCSNLWLLNIGKNRLTGLIPRELGSPVKLRLFSLEANNFTGGIPSSLGNISSLELFSISYNNLFGSVPAELGRLKSLNTFSIGPNALSGTIPLSIYNISSMVRFGTSFNKLEGTLPPTIGLTLPNLQEIYMGGNFISGVIPPSFSNASQLQVLDLPGNNLVGQIPASLGVLQELRWLGLSNNTLGNYLPNSLDFIASLTNCSHMEILDLSMNKFRGVLPNSIANFSTKLFKLYTGGNQISGSIPSALENLANLIILSLDGNLFTGAIPTSLGKLKKLQNLALDLNMLSGKIPPSIGNLTQLYHLDLSYNKLEGSIPTKIADCHNLQMLDISNNRLTGEIPKEIFLLSSLSTLLSLSHNLLAGELPVEVGKLKNIGTLDLSENNLTGKIPKTIGDCQVLEFLDLQGNFFQETLPSTLASLKGVRHLDFSRNNLTGEIPKDLEKLHSLLYLNLSFNNLEGEVPNEGVFQNVSAVSIVGNTKLCGGVPRLHLQACPGKKPKEGKTNGLKLTIVILPVAAFFLLSIIFIIYYWRRSSKRKTTVVLPKQDALSKISYTSLFQATNGFSPNMLIGKGRFSSVYKGILDEEESPVAVKVLNLQHKGADKSFIAECNALRNVRHRYLVKILTCCSSIDYNGNEFKALVFEYMSNGSLEKWLSLVPDEENCSFSGLNLLQSLNIAIDVASAIQYLHHDFGQLIIHRDLKPSNILLDNEMVAHVSDFGLARLNSNAAGFSDGQTSTVGISGTVGYAAPEYAVGGEPSRQGDVYSYGILVLEMFTGKRPTDDIFKDDFNLHNFVKMALPERLMEVVDSTLLPSEVEENAPMRKDDGRNSRDDIGGIEIETNEGLGNKLICAHVRKCLVSVLEIGVACSEWSPNDRMNMVDVTWELQRIRDAYVSYKSSGQRRRMG